MYAPGKDLHVKSVGSLYSIGPNERFGRLKFLFRRLEKRTYKLAKKASGTILRMSYPGLSHGIHPLSCYLK